MINILSSRFLSIILRYSINLYDFYKTHYDRILTLLYLALSSPSI
jgi:hypothetical protein